MSYQSQTSTCSTLSASKTSAALLFRLIEHVKLKVEVFVFTC